MIALYIISGILCLLFLILMLRLRITVAYAKIPNGSGEGKVLLGIGPVKIKLYPKKKKELKLSDFSAKKYRLLLEKDRTPGAKKKPKEQKSEKDKNEFLPGGIGETFELILELVEKFTEHLRCEVLCLKISVGTKDAASTALAYSGVSSAASFLIETIDTHTDMRLKSPRDVRIDADFDSGDIGCDIGVKFSIRIINILRAGSGFIMNYLRTLIRLDKQNSK